MSIKELKEDIEFLEELLADKDLPEKDREAHQETLTTLKTQLESLESARAPKDGDGGKKAATDGDAPVKKKAGRPAGSAKPNGDGEPKKKAGRPTGSTKKTAEDKPNAKPKKAKKEAGKIQVGNKFYNLDDCQEAMDALLARKKQKTTAAKAYKTRKPAAKAASNIETMLHQVAEAVPDKKIEGNPKFVIATFKEFKKKLNEAFTIIGKVIGKEDADKLKKALGEIDEVISKYKD